MFFYLGMRMRQVFDIVGKIKHHQLQWQKFISLISTLIIVNNLTRYTYNLTPMVLQLLA